MKKILSFVLSMMLIMSFMITPASAAENSAIFSGSTVYTTAGAEVTVAFLISDNAPFASYGISDINFNADVLTLTGISKGEASVGFFDYTDPVNNVFPDVVKVAGANSEDTQVSGALFYATFKVAEDALPGEYYVDALVDFVANINDEDLALTVYSGTVIIECEEHEYTDWEVTKEPTCTENGEKTGYCICGVKKVEVIPAIGHAWDDGKVTTAPTCTVKGVKTYTCKNDPSHTKTEELAALGHAWDEGTITKEATCTEDGEVLYTCLNDESHTYTKAVPATGHAWDEGKVTKAATCDTDGVKTYTCTECGEVKTEVIKATGHNWTDWEVVKKPTETEKGLEQRTCLTCGEVETREIEPAKDQVPDTGVRSNNYGAWAVAAVVAGAAAAFVWKRKTAK